MNSRPATDATTEALLAAVRRTVDAPHFPVRTVDAPATATLSDVPGFALMWLSENGIDTPIMQRMVQDPAVAFSLRTKDPNGFIADAQSWLYRNGEGAAAQGLFSDRNRLELIMLLNASWR